MNDTNVVTTENKVEDKKKQKEIILVNEETYGYTTTRFNEQVKNNIEKFDKDFMFQLTQEEFENLMSKKSTSSWGGRRKIPKVFTEQGVYMLMTVLKGDLAVTQSKALIRTFKAMKDYIVENQGLINQRDYLQLSLVVAEQGRDISIIKSSLNTIDNKVADVVDRLGNVVTKSELSGFINIFGESELRSEYVLWDGQPFESDLAYTAIYSKAEKSIFVIDNYIGIKTLALLKNSKSGVKIILFSDNAGKGLHGEEFNDFCKQYPECQIELRQTGKKYHDRYIVLDYGTEQEKFFHCGPSSKDGGMRIGSIVEIREREAYHVLIDKLYNMPALKLA